MPRTLQVLASLLLLPVVTAGCATSRAMAPSPPSQLPRFQFAALRGGTVQLTVLDHRAAALQTDVWVHQVASDISRSLTAAGVTVTPSETTILDVTAVLEVTIHHLRADFEKKQWKACAKLAAALIKRGEKFDALGERCTTKANLWGAATADDVMKLAYQDSLAELLSNLDRQLR